MSDDKTPFETRLSMVVESFDLPGLIALSQEPPEGDIELWRHEMMESGFLAFYSYLSYDQACDKLGDWGLDMLSEVVEAAEDFHGSPLRRMRAEVLSMRVTAIRETDAEQAKLFALQAIHELSQEVPVSNDALKFRARLYDDVAELDHVDTLHYWQAAVDDLTASVSVNLWIMYRSWEHPVAGMQEAQERAREAFEQRVNREKAIRPEMIWDLLDEGIRLADYQQLPALETMISKWLEEAIVWEGSDAGPRRLRDAGLMIHKQGKKWQRADCFAKAIECFELFITKDPAHPMEVNYMANVWEDWAHLEEQQGHSGSLYLTRAWEAYRNHEEIVVINFSPLLHYAEFLERLWFDGKIQEGPSEEKILELAVEAEKLGNGYYSGPGLIQARMAISRRDSGTAIYHLSKLLLLHELCIDGEIKRLRASLVDGAPLAVTEFLDETLVFMEDVSQGYFFNPALKYADLELLTEDETLQAWRDRMVEIRNR